MGSEKVTGADVEGYLRRQGIQYITPGHGNEAVIDCIYCGKKGHMYVCLVPSASKERKTAHGIRPGHHHCKVCADGGTWLKFKRELGDLPDLRQIASATHQGLNKKFFRRGSASPLQPKVRPDMGKDEEFHEALMTAARGETDDEEILEAWGYLTNERCLSEEVIVSQKIGFARPVVGKRKRRAVACITFPYYDRDGSLLNIKYRGLRKTAKGKNFYMRWTGCVSTPQGLESLDMSEGYVVIVEGEFDRYTLLMYGIKNVLSVPNGASNWEHQWTRYLGDFETIYICCDNDAAGQTGASNVADKVGKVRCFNVLLPLNDANACLRAGLTGEEIQEAIDEAERFPGCEIQETADLREALLQRLLGGEQTIGCSTGYDNLDLLIAGWREKEVTILTGDTGTGKTTFALPLLLHLARQGRGSVIANFEMPPIDMAMKLITHIAGKAFLELEEDEFHRAMDELESLPIYYLKGGSSTDLEEAFEVFEYAARYLGVFMFLMDPLQKAIKVDETNHKFERVLYNKAADMMMEFVFEYSTHILVVIHPKMLQNEAREIRKVTLNDLPNSARLKQDFANCLRIWVKQDKADILTPHVEVALIKKRSDHARLGIAHYEFQDGSNRYLEVDRGESAVMQPRRQLKKRRTKKSEDESSNTSETRQQEEMFT